ncbi:hypothetical protein BC567DRAFT_10476 [Phyllosticta citribraziliensis]
MSPAVAWYRSFGAAQAAVSSVALRSSRACGRSSLFVCPVFQPWPSAVCAIFTTIAAAANDSVLALAIRDSDGVAAAGQQSRTRLDSTQAQRGPTSARWDLSSSIARVCYAEHSKAERRASFGGVSTSFSHLLSPPHLPPAPAAVVSGARGSGSGAAGGAWRAWLTLPAAPPSSHPRPLHHGTGA